MTIGNRKSKIENFLLAAIGLLFVAAGCDTGAAPLAPVRGKVFYKGAPVPRGRIVFTPDATHGGSGPPAAADIQNDGSYALLTGGVPGAQSGWHRVTIVALAESAAAPAGKGFRVPRSLLPEKYRDPELSGLCREVKAGQDNEENFNLE